MNWSAKLPQHLKLCIMGLCIMSILTVRPITVCAYNFRSLVSSTTSGPGYIRLHFCTLIPQRSRILPSSIECNHNPISDCKVLSTSQIDFGKTYDQMGSQVNWSSCKCGRLVALEGEVL